MQFFNTVYLAVKQSRPLIQNYRVSLPNDVQNHVLRQPFKAFSSKSSDEQETVSCSLPEKPKRPAGVYIRYIQSIEPKLNQEFPNSKRTEIIKVAAEMYKKADKEVLLRLQKEYLNDTEQYKEKVAEYNAKLTDEQKEALTALKTVEKKNKERRVMKKIMRETNKPKRPPNPYLIYSLERRAKETPSGDVAEWSKKVSVDWNNLSEEVKKKYADKADQLTKQYEVKFAKWEASLEGTKYSYLVQKPEKSDEKPKRTKSKPKVSKKMVSSAQKGEVPQNKK